MGTKMPWSDKAAAATAMELAQEEDVMLEGKFKQR
jgi:hypothetical protein